MKRISGLWVLAAAFVLAPAAMLAQSGNDLFQKALSKERGEGQLAEAIQLYERIVTEFASDRPLAAKALLQMGRCYERLGKGEAQKSYERLMREYGDQRASADEARARLAALAAKVNAGRRDAVARRVWAAPEVTDMVGVSPDGRFVTFVEWNANGDLAVRDLALARTRRLTAADGTWTAWAEDSVFSADGQQVAYRWFHIKNGAHYQLRTIGIAGGSPRVIYDNDDVQYLQPSGWMPDNKAILVQLQRKDGSGQIALISTVDGTARVLKTLAWRGPTRISLSPDGRWIAYDAPASAEATHGDIFVLDTGGAHESAVVTHAANELDPVWTPDGRGLVFISDRTGTPAAWFVRVSEGRASGEPELVKPDLGRRTVPLGFAGGAYCYAFQTGGFDVSVVTLDPETGTPAGAPAVVSDRFVGTNSSAGWSREGALAFVSDRGLRYRQLGGRTLVIQSATGEQRELAVPMTSFRTPKWSPDGRSVLLVGRDEKTREGLYRFDIASGGVTPILRSEPGFYVNWADWLPDGRDVIYSAPSREGGGRLVRRNVESGTELELFRSSTAVRALAISPDGTQVVFHEMGLKLVPTAGGAVRDLVGPGKGIAIPGFHGLAWTPNGRYVLFPRGRRLTPRDRLVELWRVDVASGAAEPAGLSMDALRDFALDPSGRRLAYASGLPKFEIWALENVLPAPAAKPTRSR